MVSSISAKHEIPGFAHALDEAKMQDFIDRLDDLVKTQAAHIETLKVSCPPTSSSEDHIDSRQSETLVNSKRPK